MKTIMMHQYKTYCQNVFQYLETLINGIENKVENFYITYKWKVIIRTSNQILLELIIANSQWL